MLSALQSVAGTVLNLGLLQEWGWRLVQGLIVTIQIVAISCSLGFVLAYPISLARRSRNLVLSGAARSYIAFFRGTPLLCQLYLIYYGAGELRLFLTSAGLWWFFREAFYCCILAFTMNTAAYQAEIMRGALNAIPKGEIEAATALGLSRYRIARHIIWPQALLVALRPLGNELIGIIKASALAAIVTVFDLMGQTRFIFARTFDFTIYLYCAILYLLITETIRRASNRIERRLARHKLAGIIAATEAAGAAAAPVPIRRSPAALLRGRA
ncbi:MAG: ABC transporter permease subunit [Proteobacteria bacterium]|nr:ABC transporter permease subunit [Pseudomonadota bacterium]